MLYWHWSAVNQKRTLLLSQLDLYKLLSSEHKSCQVAGAYPDAQGALMGRNRDFIHALIYPNRPDLHPPPPTFSIILTHIDFLPSLAAFRRYISYALPHSPCSHFRLNSPLMNRSIPDFTSCRSVDEWLDTIKMGRYKDHFAAGGYLTLGHVMSMKQQWVDWVVTP